MLSPKAHAVHHRSYDDNFCIGSGLWNGPITWLLKTTNSIHVSAGGSSNTNAMFWLAFLVIALVVDVPIINYLMTNYLGFK
jgi:hypothetical protein